LPFTGQITLGPMPPPSISRSRAASLIFSPLFSVRLGSSSIFGAGPD